MVRFILKLAGCHFVAKAVALIHDSVLLIARQELTAGHGVCFLDFEDDEHSVTRRLLDLGGKVIIPNTLELDRIWVSPALAADVEAGPDLAFEGPFREVPFSAEGGLDQEGLFPRSVRGRRRQGP